MYKRQVERGSADWQALATLNEEVITSFGLLRGVTHLEYIKGRDDGRMYFLEAGARVGGAHVADLILASTGVDLWREWADIEIDKGDAPYALPPRRFQHGGLLQCLARTERPDLSAYTDPEIVLQTDDPDHAGLVVCSPSHARVRELLDDYTRRFAEDFLAVMPAQPPPVR